MNNTDKKQSETKPTETKAIVKKMTHEQTLDFLKKCALANCDPIAILDKLAATSTEWRAEDKPSKALTDRLNEEIGLAMPLIALDTHYELANSVMEDLRPFVIDFTNQLIAEHECKTPTEKALAESVAAAYARVLQSTNLITRSRRDTHCSEILTNFYKMVSQELDRANRHFITALTTLKQLKSPTLTVQVRANTAFVAQNQQVNATSPDASVGSEKKVYETVDPK